MKKALNLSDMEKDALREIGNIGTGNVVSALSQFINKSVDINIPETKFVSIKDFSHEIGGPEAIISSIYLCLLIRCL